MVVIEKLKGREAGVTVTYIMDDANTGPLKIHYNATTYHIHLVDPADPAASTRHSRIGGVTKAWELWGVHNDWTDHDDIAHNDWDNHSDGAPHTDWADYTDTPEVDWTDYDDLGPHGDWTNHTDDAYSDWSDYTDHNDS